MFFVSSLSPGKSRAERSRVFNLATEPTAESLKGDEGKALDLSADDYIFLPNRLPRQRQLFYQLCDLRDERLQAIVHSNDGTETECSVSTAWGSYLCMSCASMELVPVSCVCVIMGSYPCRVPVRGSCHDVCKYGLIHVTFASMGSYL